MVPFFYINCKGSNSITRTLNNALKISSLNTKIDSIFTVCGITRCGMSVYRENKFYDRGGITQNHEVLLKNFLQGEQLQKKHILFLAIYAFCAFLIFTYILFPAQSLKNRIEAIFSEQFQGELLINEIALAVPLDIIMKKINITMSKSPDKKGPLAMNIDKITASPSILKLFEGKIGLNLDISMAGGNIDTEIGKQWLGLSKKNYLECKIKNISIQDLTILQEQLDILITGLLEGKADIKLEGKDITKAEGTWSFNIQKGKIIPSHFPSFSYGSAHGKGFFKDQMILIEEINIQGDELYMMATGQVKTDPIISKFYADTEVRLKILPKLNKKLGFFSNMLPKPDKEGYINLSIYGPPHSLRFSAISVE